MMVKNNGTVDRSSERVKQFDVYARLNTNTSNLTFGAYVYTIERLIRSLRETGRVADRPRSWRPRVTS